MCFFTFFVLGWNSTSNVVDAWLRGCIAGKDEGGFLHLRQQTSARHLSTASTLRMGWCFTRQFAGSPCIYRFSIAHEDDRHPGKIVDETVRCLAMDGYCLMVCDCE